MKLLILGGTIFLGRHLTAAAMKRGYEVTLFTRGLHYPNLFPEVQMLTGDRDGDLEALHNRRWDAAIDTSGYVPRIVRDSAKLLAAAVDHYTFVSSMSVYANPDHPGLDEEAPVGKLDDPEDEQIVPESYGPLKALCEQAAEASMPGRVLIVRPGLIVGPFDPSDRFTYWPCRFHRGGEVLAPAPASAAVQFIDVRDLAEWLLDMSAAGSVGVYNAAGPSRPLAMSDVLAHCRETAAVPSTTTWVEERFLLDYGVQPWVELPLWLPSGIGDGLMQADVSKAVEQGLQFRPLRQTVRDTLEWALARGSDHEWLAGIHSEKEQAILAAWHTHNQPLSSAKQ